MGNICGSCCENDVDNYSSQEQRERLVQEEEKQKRLRLQKDEEQQERLRLQREELIRTAEKLTKEREIREKVRLQEEEEERKQEKLRQQEKQKRQLEILEKSRPKYVISNPALIKDFLKGTGFDAWSNLLTSNSPYTLIELNYSSEFYAIQTLFTSTNKKCFRVKEIKKVINPYLMMQYELMKERCMQRYGRVTEKKLFHGTRQVNIDGICKNNFNWRLRGSARGHKFGQGISFSPISNYATHYSDKTYDKIMFVAKVIVSNSCLGNVFTVIPPDNCDTTTNEKEHVIVKYEDNTFYPCYIIYYQGIDSNLKSKRFY